MDTEYIIDLTEDAETITASSDGIKTESVLHEEIDLEEDYIIELNPDFKEDEIKKEQEDVTDLEILPPPLTLDDPSPSRNFKRRRSTKCQRRHTDSEEINNLIDCALTANDEKKQEVNQRFQRSCKDKVKNYSDFLPFVDVAEDIKQISLIKEQFCDLCDASFEKVSGLKRHKRIKHKTILTSSLTKNSVTEQSSFVDDIKPDIDEIHLASSNSQTPAIEQGASSKGGQRSKPKPRVTDTKKSAVKKLYPCIECGKTFSLSCNLSRHMHIHRGTAPQFKCQQCGKLFTSKQGLRGHIRFIHTGERPYQCKKCSMSFATNSDLTRHQSKHSELRKYKCNECGKAFKQRSALIQHVQRKGKQKTWHCQVCPKRFITKNDLKCHMVVHTKIKLFECESCQRKFSHRLSLEAHVRVHTGVMPYVCSVCGKKFAHLSNRNRHIRQIHKNINTDTITISIGTITDINTASCCPEES